MIHELRRGQQLEKLDRARVPAGDITRQLFEDGGGAFAPAITDRIRHFRARRQLIRPDRMERAIADQVADIRQHPRRAGFDELVVVKLVEIFLENADLLRDEREQFA